MITKSITTLLVLLLLNTFLLAGVTPLNQKILEEEKTTIECEYTQTEKKIFKIFANMPEKGTYHYNVVLPKGYYSDETTKYPCIFVASPGGNAHIGNIGDYIKKNKWIVILLVESKNGSPQEIAMGNFLAAHDDAIKRFRIQEGLKFTTGFSGGARCASYNAGMRKGFGGFILQGAGFGYDFSSRSGTVYYSATNFPKMAVYMIMGTNDSNKIEIERVQRAFSKIRNPLKVETFDGGHSWAPKESMNRGLAWLEQQAFKSTNNRDIFIKYFDKAIESISEAKDETKYESYLTLEMVMKRAKKFKLNSNKSYKQKITDLRKLHASLKKEKIVKTEIKLGKSFDAIVKREDKFRIGMMKKKYKPKKKQREMAYLTRSYTKIIDKNPDSYYAKIAEEKLDDLKTIN